jgi:hypothetical protein
MLETTGQHIDTRELDRLFQLYPLLHEAHNVIRSVNSQGYLQAADRFVTAWSQALVPMCGMELLCGTNLTIAIDAVFENTQSTDKLKKLVSDLKRLTAFDIALSYLSAQPVCRGHMSLEEATKIHLAFITVSGFRHLYLFRGKAVANSWIRTWQQQVGRYILQQSEHSTASLAPEQYLPGRVPSASKAIETYVTRFGSTAGLSIAIAGVLPFSEYASQQMLVAVIELAECFEPLFRLVQDVWVDPKDKLNLGIFTVASEKGTSIAEASKLIASSRYAATSVESQIGEEEKAYFVRTQKAIDNLLARYAGTDFGPLMVTFSSVLFACADDISANCEAMHSGT